MVKILDLLLNSDTLKLYFERYNRSYNTSVKFMALCGCNADLKVESRTEKYLHDCKLSFPFNREIGKISKEN